MHPKTWSIKNLLIAGGITIISLVISFFLLNKYLNQKQATLHQLQLLIAQSSNSMLMLRRNEKDFLARIEQKYINRLNNEAEQLKAYLLDVEILMNQVNVESTYNAIGSIQSVIDYVAGFNELAETIIKIHGQGNAYGLTQQLQQESIRFQQNMLYQQHNSALEQFIAVQDAMQVFLDDLNDENKLSVDRAFKQLQNLILSDPSNAILEAEFKQLKKVFERVDHELALFGYDHNSGQLGELRKTIHRIENQLEILFNTVPTQISNQLDDYRTYYYFLVILLCLSIVTVNILVIRSIVTLEKDLIQSKQKERDANKAKSSFLANMSHEIRTPLNGIIGMTEILNESKLPAAQQDFVTTINSSSQSLLMLINDILDLSKIESGHLEICPHTCSIREVIFDTAALVAPQAQQKNIKIKIEMDSKLPSYVYADEQKLRQVMMNLASNGLKFTEVGSLLFKLTVVSMENNKARLFFSVKDTGVGIEEGKQEQIFEEFKQENSNTSHQFGGTGLGLAISRKIIRMMGGDITLTSVKGLGSEFSFILELDVEAEPKHEKKFNLPPIVYCSAKPSSLLIQELKYYQYPLEVLTQRDEILPHLSEQTIILIDNQMDDIAHCLKKYQANHLVLIRDNSDDNTYSSDKIAGYITLPLLGERLTHLLKTIVSDQDSDPKSSAKDNTATKSLGMVLVVEDNKVNQQIVTLNLDKLGLGYHIANNGEEAVTIYKEHHEQIFLILMDCMMPIMDGFEATVTIRRFEQMGSIEAVSIIALTASILDDDIQRCFDSGMNDYLPKPFKKAVLIEKLEKKCGALLKNSE